VDGLDATSGAQQFIGYLRVPKSGVYHFALITQGKAIVRLHVAGSKALSGMIG